MSDNLTQNNDQVIESPIFKNGLAINTEDLTSATYKLYSLNKKTLKLTKSFNQGITRKENTLTINISKADSTNLRGQYYHELTIVDPTLGESTVFKKDIIFEATVNV